ncbi:MAG: hypothetical protein NC302_03770 [Bacteroidales bacterium]|nr:hypothetical protein [Bacteroidales bacterium]MCM1414596.1 hypothetical protein [bacterium]MCM1423855.1 hypothetical protein [bacterium]
MDNYDPTDPEQLKEIGKFMLATQAQAGGNMMLLRLSELAGLSSYNREQYGTVLAMEAGVDALGVEFGDCVEGRLATLGTEQTISYAVTRNRTDATRNTAFGYEVGETGGLGYVSIAGLETNAFSESVNAGLNIIADYDAAGRVQEFTVKKEEETAGGAAVLGSSLVESFAVSYDRDTVEQLQANIQAVGNFIAGSTHYIFGDAQQELFEKLDASPIQGNYAEMETDKKSLEVALNLGLRAGLGLEAGVGLEGVSSCGYETENGTYEAGRKYVSNTNEIADEVEKNAYSITQIIGEPIQAAAEYLGSFLAEVSGTVKAGIENKLAKVKQSVSDAADEWFVHIMALKNENAAPSSLYSYEITAYSMQSTGRAADQTQTYAGEYHANTLGEPYYVYVTDNAENEIADYSENPLTLTLGYTEEMLQSAGLDETKADDIKIYRYSEDVYGYVCIGGVIDQENKAVSAEITKPGQYVLATDGAAPTVKELRVSTNTNKPVITAVFHENSGFQEFSMKLDGVEVIGGADFSKYYNKAYNAFVYQVEEELAAGAHTCSVYAVDTAGNAMQAPYEIEFYIDPTQIGDVPKEDIPEDGMIPDGIWAAGAEDGIYTGSNIKQSLRLYDRSRRLQEKADYTVSYKNNKAAYTYTDADYQAFEENLKKTGKSVKTGTFDPNKAPQVIIQMKGNYSGKKIVYFRIEPADIAGNAFEADDMTVTYTGKKQTPVPKLVWNGRTLKYGTDYSIPEYDNAKVDAATFKEPQNYSLTLAGKNNFRGERRLTLTISKSAKQISMNKVTIKGIRNMPWTGKQIVQTGFSVKYKNTVLPENSDYTADWGVNTDAGTGVVTLIGTGEDRDGDGHIYRIGKRRIYRDKEMHVQNSFKEARG